jgi:hypothetical protein
MVANNITSTNGVKSDFILRAFTYHSVPPMPCVGLIIYPLGLGQDLRESSSCAARSVFFMTMMNFNHFGIEVRPQNLRSLSGKPEKGINPHAVIG